MAPEPVTGCASKGDTERLSLHGPPFEDVMAALQIADSALHRRIDAWVEAERRGKPAA